MFKARGEEVTDAKIAPYLSMSASSSRRARLRRAWRRRW
jgi:hypothetical protein